jgi:hypothetical protein
METASPGRRPILTAQFFEERCQRQHRWRNGRLRLRLICPTRFDEPESALSPARQIEFLELMRRMEVSGPLSDHHGHAFAFPDGHPFGAN